MPERVHVRRIGSYADELQVARGAQDARDRRDRTAGELRQHRGVESQADHRRVRQHGAIVGGQRRRTFQDRGANGQRQLQHAAVDALAQQLLREERIPACDGQRFGDAVCADRAAAGKRFRGEPSHVARRKRPERDAPCPASAQLAERYRERMIEAQLVGAICDDENDAPPRDVLRRELEELERRTVGPVRVLDDDERRRDLAVPAQRVADRRVVRARIARRRLLVAVAEVRHDARQRAADERRRVEHAGIRRVQRAQGLRDRIERRSAVTPAVSDREPRAARLEHVADRFEKSGLSDPGIAGDQHQRPDSAGRITHALGHQR